ncbi:hypothetical protein Tco_0349833 [Tanacetum coccineum]
MNRVTDIPESLLISFYISGLKLHLQRKLLVSKPTTLGDAFALARITEARLEGQVAALKGTTAKIVVVLTPQRQLVPRLRGVLGTANTTKSPLLPNPTGTSKPLAIKWISPAERLNKGLCFNCDNQWTCGHTCPGKVTYDYAHQTIEFTLLDTTYSLKGDDALRMEKISLHQMRAMLEHDDVYGVYEVHHLSIETKVEEMRPKTVGPRLAELEQLLLRFDSLF